MMLREPPSPASRGLPPDALRAGGRSATARTDPHPEIYALLLLASLGPWVILMLSGATVATPSNPIPHADICGAAHP